MKKLVFIINPISGALKKDKLLDHIKSGIDPALFEYEIEFTNSPGHATELCHEWVGKKADIIVAVGGDGSVNEIAKGLVNTETTLGIIPAGSGNGLAHFLKIPQNFKKAIGIISRGNEIKIDTGLLNDELFVSIAGIGFDGLVAEKFSKSSRRGFLTYMKIVTEEYPFYKPRKYKIYINGKKIIVRALFISFANSDQFGYKTSIAPQAQIDDGLLDVCIAKKPPIIELPLIGSLLYWRQIDKSKYIDIIKASELTIKTKNKRWVNIDGEAFRQENKIHVKVKPLSLRVIVP